MISINNYSFIRANDILDDLRDENQRLLDELSFAKQCLIVLTEVKSFVDLNSQKLKSNLNSIELQNYEQLIKKLSQLIDEKRKRSTNCKNTSADCGSVNKAKKSFPNLRNDLIVKKPINEFVIKCQPNVNRIETNRSLYESKINYKGLKLVYNKPIDNNNESINKSITLEPKSTPTVVQKPTFDLYKTSLGRPKKPSTGDQKPKYYNYVKNRVCAYPDKGSTLTDHKNLHTGDLPYQCSQCEKAFKSVSGLKLHIKRIHEASDQLMPCGIEDCASKFTNKYSLELHQRYQHYKAKRFHCTHDNCEYRTAVRAQLFIHYQSHNTDKPFKCSIADCDKSYKSKNQLSYHIKTHRTERNFHCKYEGCGKSFVMSEHLSHHIKNSHSEVFYHCDWPGCEYSHRRKGMVKNHATVHSNEYNVACDWPHCEKKFKTRDKMRAHLLVHKGDKKYLCHWPGCQFRCITNGNLTKHMKKHLK